ncbi:short chain dehydrogenase [Hyaloraphidium curvatum]|nr:short chain dehydrogenase [Hyaloraphidium curvatum]
MSSPAPYSFSGKLAVVTGGASGMGRSLVLALARDGCSVATCDLDPAAAEATAKAAMEVAPNGVLVTGHGCDVAKESDWQRFRDEVVSKHRASKVDLIFNNAGVAAGWSFFTDKTSREQWERTFAVNWYGVYYGCRTFLPLVVASPAGRIINTASINAIYHSHGHDIFPHTSYSAAKAAVKAFTEALIVDFRINAPHVKAAIVMPGHVGTRIVENTAKAYGNRVSKKTMEDFEKSGLTPDQAAAIILNGVRRGDWRILVGEDAEWLDAEVRRTPLEMYDQSFYDRYAKAREDVAAKKEAKM